MVWLQVDRLDLDCYGYAVDFLLTNQTIVFIALLARTDTYNNTRFLVEQTSNTGLPYKGT